MDPDQVDGDTQPHRTDAPVNSQCAARVMVRVIPTDEKVTIARGACQVLG